MKRLWCLLIGLLPFGLSANEMKVPFSVPLDFSKKGTVYETDFQAPWNIWGSLVEFYILTNIAWKTTSSEEYKIYRYIYEGHPQEINSYFKLKVTLIPLGWASNDITVWIGELPRKEFKDGEKIEFEVSVPLYGKGFGKTIMIADLQRLRNYHIRVESLDNVELPKGVLTKFKINRYSTKH